MSIEPERDAVPTPIQLHERAIRDVAIIRGTMERSTVFTAVSGPGTMAMGVVALIGAPIAALRQSEFWWVNAWALIGIAGFTAGMAGMMLKARRTGVPLFRGAGRRFMLAFAPAILAGSLLEEYFIEQGTQDMLPAMWMLLYGVAVTTSGAYSVPVIPLMGLSFMLLGTVTAFAPIERVQLGFMTGPDLMLTLAFGGLHLVYGAVIWWRHDAHDA